MRKLSPKKSGFVGKSLFVREDLTYEIATSETLPETFELGFEIPKEEGGYFARTKFGALYVKVAGATPWSTHTGILGDYTYTSGGVLESKAVHDIFLLTDGESDGAQHVGVSVYNYGLIGEFTDGNGEYAKSFIEIGDSLIVPNQPMSINKDTGDINWIYLDSLDRPASPWGLRNNRSVVNEDYFIFLDRNTDIVVLDTETGTLIERLPMSSIPNVDYVEEGNLLQLQNNNQFLYMGDDYTSNVGRAYILTVDPTATLGNRLTFVEHPESGVLHNGKRLFWGWYEFNSYYYWGIWNNSYFIDKTDGSYYLFYYSDGNPGDRGTLAKFNSSHTLEWVYDLTNIPGFGIEYFFYQFVKANSRIALLPCYTQNEPAPLSIIVLDDATGANVPVDSAESAKVSAYTALGDDIQILYAKSPSGNRIPFVGTVENILSFIYGYFDMETLTWVETVEDAPPGIRQYFTYPQDAITGVLQKEADGRYFYFVDSYEETFPGNWGYDATYLFRLSSNLSELTFEKLDFGGKRANGNDIRPYSIQSTLSSEGRIFGINYNAQIFSSVTDGRPRANATPVVLEKDKWYDFKTPEWSTGVRPLAGRTVNASAVYSAGALPATANYIPLSSLTHIFNRSTARTDSLTGATSGTITNFGCIATTICPDQQTIVGIDGSSAGSSRFYNVVTGMAENPNSYPFYSISATIRPYKYLFRQDGTPIVVRASSTSTIIMRHNGTGWVADATLALTSASSQRYFMHNDTLYAFRAVNGGDATISVYNWAAPAWTTHATLPAPVGSTVYYDTPANFALANSVADRNGILYFSNGFEYNMDTGVMTEVPYPATFYSAHRVAGGVPSNRITLQIFGDYMLLYFARVGVSYMAIRPLADSLPSPF